MGAIYLQEDFSDLLCERSLEWTRHTMRDALSDFRGHLKSGVEPCVEISWPKNCKGQIIYALGDIGPHKDKGFPPHSLLWVLRGSGALVTCRGGPKTAQTTGTLIAFDCHKDHELRFRKSRHGITRLWCAWNMDADIPWTAASAREAVASALATLKDS
jgi:hypothetical protein